MDQSQVDGLNFLLDKLEADSFSLTQASYVLATVKWESANTFQPIKEKRGRVGTRIRVLQDRYWNTGAYGRGYVQLTWPKNYEKFGMPDPVDYDLALKPEKAYEILSVGMRDGLFTGKKLSDYVNDTETDYHDARRVVNGTDRADAIAQIANKFERILTTSLVADTQTVVEEKKEPELVPQPPPAPTPAQKPEVLPVAPPKTSLTTRIAAAVSAIMPIVTATGLKIGGVEFQTGGLIAMAAVVIVGMVVGAWLWNSSQNRRHEELLASMGNLASPDRANVIAAGSKV